MMNYEEIRSIVQEAIDSGRIYFAEKIPLGRPENKKVKAALPNYGKAVCIGCKCKFPKLSPTSKRCSNCVEEPRKCAICENKFANKSRRKKPTQTCSLPCAKELGRRTRKANGL